MRSTSRLTGVDRETVGTLLASVGAGCAALLHEAMVDLPCKELELDELWAFVGKKDRNVRETDDATKGIAWTWLAVDRETKLVPDLPRREAHGGGRGDVHRGPGVAPPLARADLHRRAALLRDGHRQHLRG